MKKMPETFDYKEGFAEGWDCLWAIMGAIDNLEEDVLRERKREALTGALVMLLAGDSATRYHVKGVEKLMSPINDIFWDIVYDEWGKAVRVITKLKGALPIRLE